MILMETTLSSKRSFLRCDFGFATFHSIYPAVDPLDSTSRMMDPRIIGDEHYQIAKTVQKILQDYKSLQDIIAILGTLLS